MAREIHYEIFRRVGAKGGWTLHEVVTKRDLLFVLPKTYRGKHLPHPRLEVLRGRVVTVDADEPLPIELDGEQPGTTPVRFEVVPRALRLRVPKR